VEIAMPSDTPALPEGSPEDDYVFTQNWFEFGARPIWDQMMPLIDPSSILEVGSYEGASSCYLIDSLANIHPLELHCVDSWEGGIEHAGTDMAGVEARFRHNTRIAIGRAAHPVRLEMHKGLSDSGLVGLLAAGKAGFFDFIYIDGSHQAPDVLSDAVLGFKLLKVGGVMAFDDYIWQEALPYGKDPLRCPKPAIDAFVNINMRKLDIVPAPIGHFYVRKVSD
jgi:predicted O-methyltransferase YrrM